MKIVDYMLVAFGEDEGKYEDIHFGDQYTYHTAPEGLFKGATFSVSINYLRDGEVGLGGANGMNSHFNTADEFRDCVANGVYVKTKDGNGTLQSVKDEIIKLFGNE